MFIGHARVSIDDRQRDALVKAGCERVFEDTAKTVRSGLTVRLTDPCAGIPLRWGNT